MSETSNGRRLTSTTMTPMLERIDDSDRTSSYVYGRFQVA
jgi:hypothetical protein